ncbi:hypothetical protein Ddye_028336 [Dipteronia dyeriana]|uniref:KIB1-4 beta-propeller domain-containing protein n=1 Tax=Dipteronia dyeriana TaxID=168575 RepID=A0AAD9TR00_9ROSI|nr:hypothetical protein Ddye_028336 [Dipteronia dyeriana]
MMSYDLDQTDDRGICYLWDPAAKRSYIVKEAAVLENRYFFVQNLIIQGKLEIQTCKPGDKSWKMLELSAEFGRVVYRKWPTQECFYCIFSDGKMGAFNIKHKERKLLSEQSPLISHSHSRRLIVASNGDLLLCNCSKLSLWRFDISNTK